MKRRKYSRAPRCRIQLILLIALLSGLFYGGHQFAQDVVRRPIVTTSAGDFDYTNMLWRVRGADIVGLSDGDPMTGGWLDTSGNSRNWAASGNNPLYQTNEINSHPAVQFRGIANQDHFVGPNLSGLSLTEIDVYILLKADADPPGSVNAVGLWMLCPMSTSFFSLTEWPATDNNIKEAAFTPATSNQRLTVDPSPALTSWRLYRLIAKTGTNNYEIQLDGSSLATQTLSTLGFPSTTYLGRASWNSGGNNSFWQGKVAEFFAFSTKCGSTQYGTIRDYLNTFYGLSISRVVLPFRQPFERSNYTEFEQIAA
jgi:hypothetical protein